jgi:hypothetical protein
MNLIVTAAGAAGCEISPENGRARRRRDRRGRPRISDDIPAVGCGKFGSCQSTGIESDLSNLLEKVAVWNVGCIDPNEPERIGQLGTR